MQILKTVVFCTAVSALMLGACGDDGGATAPTGPDADVDITPDAAVWPLMPTIGTQIDRAGRPAISTALINPFNLDGNADVDKNAYNADEATGDWAVNWSAGLAGPLAIYDSLDAMCGNQFAYNAENAGYGDLAGVLANDWLTLDTTQGTCGEYLAVEAGVADLCGGRTPLDDVIDRSYSVLAAGVLSGVGDGVDADDATHSASVWPFLAAPQ